MSSLMANPVFETGINDDIDQHYFKYEEEGHSADLEDVTLTNNDQESFTQVSENTVENSEQTYEIEFITTIPGFHHSISKPFSIIVQKDNYCVSVQSEDFKIYVTERNYDEALELFFDMFIEDFYNWIETENSSLTQDAIDLKNKYLEHVRIK